MVFFHMNYLLVHVFWGMNIFFSDTFWFFLGRIVVVMFIFVSGIAFFLSSEKREFSAIVQGNVRRFLILASIALVISLATYTLFYEQRILFGIIHFFAIASILSLGILRFWGFNIFLGIGSIFLGYYFSSLSVTSDILAPIGLHTWGFFSADYYPIFPWFGYFLLGFGVTSMLQKRAQLHALLDGGFFGGESLAYIGRYSLLIYVIHVPIIYGVLRVVYS